MKTRIASVIGLAVMAVAAFGEDARMETNRTSTAEVIVPSVASRLTQRQEPVDEIKSGRTTFKGPLVVLVKNRNPLAVFNPFKPAEPGVTEQRPLYDPHLGAPQGIVLFSVHR